MGIYACTQFWSSVGQIVLYLFDYSWKEQLPGPRVECNIDWSCSDAELFSRVFSPTGQLTIGCLGDLWEDATWYLSNLCTALHAHARFRTSICLQLTHCMHSQLSQYM